MLRVVYSGNSLPTSWPCDPAAEFQSGQVAELVVIGNQVMATVSSGGAPLGLIDDVNTKAFTNVSWNETVFTPVIQGVPGPNNTIVLPYDVKCELRRPNIVPSSFSSNIDVVLNPINGIIVFVAGTELNTDLTGGGTLNGIKCTVNYTYAIANIPGDSSTIASGRITIWIQRGVFQTDQYESSVAYPLKANLYVNEIGMLTTRKCHKFSPSIAMVTAPPSALNPFMEFLWY